MERLIAIMEEIGLPYAYHHFAEGEGPDSPFICFLVPGNDNFAADGLAYFKIDQVNIELYHYTKGITRIAKADGLQESWVCFGKIKHKKKFCDSLSLRGDRLREAAELAMGMDEFNDRAFTERVDKVFTTEGEALEFHFYDGTVKEVPILLYRTNHMATMDPHQKFPGYEWTQDGYRVVPEEAEMVRLVFHLYAEGMKIEHIRKEVEAAGYASFRGKVSHKFITRMLDDERYIGRRTLAARYSGTGKDEVIENDHESIIDPELFAKVQALRKISWQKQARRLATWEERYGKNSTRAALCSRRPTRRTS